MDVLFNRAKRAKKGGTTATVRTCAMDTGDARAIKPGDEIIVNPVDQDDIGDIKSKPGIYVLKIGALYLLRKVMAVAGNRLFCQAMNVNHTDFYIEVDRIKEAFFVKKIAGRVLRAKI